jgi:outer membrane lipoprotein SlyB
VAAAAGGAYAGHQIERNMGGEKQVEVTVRFDDGSIRTLPQQTAGRWHQGDRVRMNNGQLLPN